MPTKIERPCWFLQNPSRWTSAAQPFGDLHPWPRNFAVVRISRLRAAAPQDRPGTVRTAAMDAAVSGLSGLPPLVLGSSSGRTCPKCVIRRAQPIRLRPKSALARTFSRIWPSRVRCSRVLLNSRGSIAPYGLGRTGRVNRCSDGYRPAALHLIAGPYRAGSCCSSPARSRWGFRHNDEPTRVPQIQRTRGRPPEGHARDDDNSGFKGAAP
jgi:hypothetical protein